MSLLRAALRTTLRPRVLSVSTVARPTLRLQSFPLQRANFASGSGLSKEDIQARVLGVLKTFDKVSTDKLTTSSSFAGDLGLDSLDAVEVVMAIEEEFAIEIPDPDADEIKTVQQAINYIAQTPEAH